MDAMHVWTQSDGDVTKAFYADLEQRGPIGVVAVNLFRANKCSDRAKKYRGGIRGKGSYKSMAYDRKEWSIGNLVRVLGEHAAALGIVWGWKQDPAQEYHCWVIYVDLPGHGQVSFHTGTRGKGPDYPGEWDGMRMSTERICAFCDHVMQLEGKVSAR
jgi:hypothetical protein